MNKLNAFFVCMIVALASLFIGCLDRVEVSEVGIRVALAGDNRGVQDIPVVTGWVFYNPITEDVITFPVNIQNVVWTKSVTEGNPVDESLTFSSSEGVVVNCDVGLAFRIDPKKAPQIYMKFKERDLLVLGHGYIRNAVRESFNIVASKTPVQDIYGAGKSKLVQDVLVDLNKKMTDNGIIVDQLTINGALRLPPNVAEAINKALQATQSAVEAENKVRQIKAEAEQNIAKANGYAEAARIQAKGDADAMLTKAKAEARSNMIIKLSTTDTILKYNAINKWNGRMPMYMGSGNMPLLTFDTTRTLGADADKRLEELLAEDSKDNKDPKEAAK